MKKYVLFYMVIIFIFGCNAFADDVIQEESSGDMDQEIVSVFDSGEDTSDFNDSVPDGVDNSVPGDSGNVNYYMVASDPSDELSVLNDKIDHLYIAISVIEFCCILNILLPRFRRIADKFSGSKKGGK